MYDVFTQRRMIPIYNRYGRAVAWLDGRFIRDLKGPTVAFIRGEHVYTVRGIHVGYFQSGYFRDQVGAAVAFIDSAEGNPRLPLPGPTPEAPPAWPSPPVISIPSAVPDPPQPKARWSELDWSRFVMS